MRADQLFKPVERCVIASRGSGPDRWDSQFFKQVTELGPRDLARLEVGASKQLLLQLGSQSFCFTPVVRLC